MQINYYKLLYFRKTDNILKVLKNHIFFIHCVLVLLILFDKIARSFT